MSTGYDRWRPSDDNDWTSESQPKYLSDKQKTYIATGWTAAGLVIGGGLGSIGGLEGALGCGSIAGLLGALTGIFIANN